MTALYGINDKIRPDLAGLIGEFGGKIGHPGLAKALQEIEDGFHAMIAEPDFVEQIMKLQQHYVGRPSPIYHCQRLSDYLGGADIYLKREDLNHTGSHKINHCWVKCYLPNVWGRKKSSLKRARVSMVWL